MGIKVKDDRRMQVIVENLQETESLKAYLEASGWECGRTWEKGNSGNFYVYAPPEQKDNLINCCREYFSSPGGQGEQNSGDPNGSQSDGGGGQQAPAQEIPTEEWEQKIKEYVHKMQRQRASGSQGQVNLMDLRQMILAGAYKRAREIIRNIQPEKSEGPDIARYRIWLAVLEEKWDEAISIFEQCPQVIGNSARIRFFIGLAYYKVGHLEEAEGYLATCLRQREEELKGISAAEQREYLEICSMLANIAQKAGNYGDYFRYQVLSLSRGSQFGLLSEDDIQQIARNIKGAIENLKSESGFDSLVSEGLYCLPPNLREIILPVGQSFGSQGLEEQPTEIDGEGQEPFSSIFEQLYMLAREKPSQAIQRLSQFIEEWDDERERAALLWLRANIKARDPVYQESASQEYDALYEQYFDLLDMEQQADILLFMAKRCFRNQDWACTLDYTDKYLAYSTTGDICALRGLALYHDSNIETAAEWLLRALENGYEDKEVYKALGDIYYKKSDFDKATSYFERAWDLNPEDFDIVFNLILIHENDPVTRASYCREFIIRAKDRPRSQEYGDALSYLLEALIEMGAGEDEIVLAAGDLMEYYLVTGNTDKAVNVLGNLGQLSPGAKVDLALVFESAPDDPEALSHLSDLLSRMGMEEVFRVPPNLQLLRKIGLSLRMIDTTKYQELLDLYQANKEEIERDPLIATDVGDIGVEFKLNLGTESVLIVGGYEKVRKRAGDYLKSEYGLGEWLEVPPPWEAGGVAHSNMSAYLKRASLVVVVANCIKHLTTTALNNYLDSMDSPPPVVYPLGKGHSNIISEVVKFFRGKFGAMPASN